MKIRPEKNFRPVRDLKPYFHIFRGNEIGSKEIDKVQFFAPGGGYFTKRDSDGCKHLSVDNVSFAIFQYSLAVLDRFKEKVCFFFCNGGKPIKLLVLALE